MQMFIAAILIISKNFPELNYPSTQISINWEMDKETMGPPYHGMKSNKINTLLVYLDDGCVSKALR